MIKVCAFFKRRSGTSVEAFQQYWRTHHADLAKRLPGVRRYVQCHTLPGIYRRREPAYDGVAELWFDDTDALRAVATSEIFARVRADEPNFMDPSIYGEIVTQEHIIKDGPIPLEGVKNIEFVKRRPDLTVEAFQKHWREVHGPLGASIPPVLRYVQCHTRAAAYRDGATPVFDGLALTWFESVDTMRQSAQTPEYAATRADEPNFVAGELEFIITTEHAIVT